MNENIKQAIRDFILETFLPGEDPSQLTDDLPLISAGILDSIATLKLIVYLEEKFGIALEAHEADKDHLDSVNQITELVVAKKEN